MTRALAWFTHDLRVTENPMLREAATAEALLCVYVVDTRLFKSGRYAMASMGYLRWAFLQEALSELNQALQSFGQTLHVVYGEPSVCLASLITEFEIDRVITSTAFGWDERQTQERVQSSAEGVQFTTVNTSTLFEADDIENLALSWPMSFSKFRKKTKSLSVKPWPSVSTLPKPVTERTLSVTLPEGLPLPAKNKREFFGGLRQGQTHWQQYVQSPTIHQYKETRNALDEWSSSTKLSPWVNQGALAIRNLYVDIQEQQQQSAQPDNVEWILVELLWREFFQWLGLHQQTSLFSFQGLNETKPLTSFYPERFQKWCHGTTPWPLVNAIMNQLRETGYISNRARQIAASALVNELSVDWRYGAAWFEHHLLDYDVNVNWGNWQYIAGVGVDTQGGRHFNLEKQRQLFDPEGAYQMRWTTLSTVRPLYELDPTGWPVAYK